VEQQVHRAQAGGRIGDLPPPQRVQLEVLLLVLVEPVVLGNVVVGREQEAAGAHGRIHEGLPRLGLHHVHEGADQRSRGEVLPGPGLGGRLLQQALVGVALHVGVEARPLLAVQQVHDEAAQLRRILNLVLGLAEDQAQRPL
jgi:hypothetical protein